MGGTASAARTLDDEYKPKNAALQKLNETIVGQAKNAGNNADASVGAVNLALQYFGNLLLFFAAPLAVLFLIYAGNTYVTAFGDQTKLDAAKKMIIWTLVGLVAIMIAYVLTRSVVQLTTKVPTGSTATPAPAAPAAPNP